MARKTTFPVTLNETQSYAKDGLVAIARVQEQLAQLSQAAETARRRDIEARSREEALLSELRATRAIAAAIERRPTWGVTCAAIAIMVSAAVLLTLLVKNTSPSPVTLSHVGGNGAGGTHLTRTEADTRNFGKSYERLARALSGFSAVSAEEVLRAAREVAPEAAKGCAVRWTAGEAALQYGQQSGDSALARTISHCADAVEALRQYLTNNSGSGGVSGQAPSPGPGY